MNDVPAKIYRSIKPILLILLSLAIIAIIFRLIFFFGPDRRDDIRYGQAAYNLFHGQYFSGEVFFAIGRLSLIFPTGLMYWLFGVNDFSSIATSITASVVSIILLYMICIKFSNRYIAIIAGILYALNPLDIQYATQLLPDSINACLLLGVLYTWIIATDASGKQNTGRKSLIYYIFSGVLLAIAYYTRINDILILPILVVYTLFRKTWSYKILALPLATLAVVVICGILFWIKTGDFFFIENAHLGLVEGNITRSKELVSNGMLWGFGSSLKTIFGDILLWPWIISGLLGSIIIMINKKFSQYGFIIMWFLCTWLVFEIYFTLGFSVALDRYLNVLIAPASIISAIGLWTLYRQVGTSRITRIIQLVVMFVFIFLMILPLPTLYRRHKIFGGGRNGFAETEMAYNIIKDYPKKKVVVSPNFWVWPMNYHMGYETGINLFDESSFNSKDNELTSINQYIDKLQISDRDIKKKVINTNTNPELKDKYFIISPRQVIIDYSNLYHIAGKFRKYDIYYSQGDESLSNERLNEARIFLSGRDFKAAYQKLNESIMYNPFNGEAQNIREKIRLDDFRDVEIGNLARTDLNTKIISADNFKKDKPIEYVIDSVWRTYGFLAVQDNPNKDVAIKLDFQQTRTINKVKLIWGKSTYYNADASILVTNIEGQKKTVNPSEIIQGKEEIELRFKDISIKDIEIIIHSRTDAKPYVIKDIVIY